MSTKPLPPYSRVVRDTRPLPPIFGQVRDTKPLAPLPEVVERPRPLALIVEDEENLAAAYAEALQMMAFETEIAYNGEQALGRLGEVVPRVVVLDLHLPVIAGTHSLRYTGMGVLCELRDNARLSETRVIIATGDALAAEYVSSQADLVLVKPVTCDQLQDFVARLIPQ